MRTLSHLLIFQGFVALYHALYHRHMDYSIRGHMSDPCRFSRSDKHWQGVFLRSLSAKTNSQTDLFHSMGYLHQRYAVLSVVCRDTLHVNRPLVLRGNWQGYYELNIDTSGQSRLHCRYAISLYSHINPSYVFLIPFIARIMLLDTHPRC